MQFHTFQGGASAQRMTINDDVAINTGNLVIGTSQKGVATTQPIMTIDNQYTGGVSYIDFDNTAASTNACTMRFLRNTNTSGIRQTIWNKGDGTASSAMVLVHESGDLTLSTGSLFINTSGEGIDFSATSDASGMTSELLDDYEEGTWTPVLSDGTNTATMNGQSASYTKVGNVVYYRVDVSTTSLTGSGTVSGAIRITGLPFTNSNTVTAGVVSFASGLAITAGHNVGVYSEASQAYLTLSLWDATTGTTAMQASEWSADGRIIAGGHYYV